MKLSAESRQKVSAWLQSKIDNHFCQTCGNGTWTIGEMLVLPCPSGSGMGQPVVIVQCATCACVKMFDAVSLGINPENPL